MYKTRRVANCADHELNRDVLLVVLHFAIDNLKAWSVLIQVNRQFNRVVSDPLSLLHVKVHMADYFGWLRKVPGVRAIRVTASNADWVMTTNQLASLVRLHTLDLSGKCDGRVDCRGGRITDVGLLAMASRPMMTLTTLDLSNCAFVTDAGIQALAAIGTVQNLFLSGCPSITDKALASLPLANVLRCLHLNECDAITDKGIQSVARQLALQELGVRHTRITDIGLQALAPLLALEALDLTGCADVTDVGMQALNPLAALKSLQAFGCKRLTLAGLRKLPCAQSLRVLDFRNCGVDGTDATAFEPFMRLRVLGLRGRNISDVTVQSLSRLVEMEDLNLSGCKLVTNLAALSGMVALQVLDLSDCGTVTDAGLAGLTEQVLDLRTLNLSGNRLVSDAGVWTLAHKLKRLRTLGLSRCTITDVGMGHLAQMVTLYVLELAGCTLITDAGVRRLVSLAELRALNLSNSRGVTIDGVAALQSLVTLEVVNARRSTIGYRILPFVLLRS